MESESSRGATFWLELPNASAHTSVDAAGPSASDTNIEKALLFYMEDYTSNLRVVATMLRQRPQWTLIAASSAERALELVRWQRTDAILMLWTHWH